MLQVGDKVRVLPPFDSAYPDEQEVIGINPDTGAYQCAPVVRNYVEFDEMYLEKVAP